MSVKLTIIKTKQGWYLEEEFLDENDFCEETHHVHCNTFLSLIGELSKLYKINLPQMIKKEKNTNVVKFLKLVKGE
jgi:hypothetical protein